MDHYCIPEQREHGTETVELKSDLSDVLKSACELARSGGRKVRHRQEAPTCLCEASRNGGRAELEAQNACRGADNRWTQRVPSQHCRPLVVDHAHYEDLLKLDPSFLNDHAVTIPLLTLPATDYTIAPNCWGLLVRLTLLLNPINHTLPQPPPL